jgi:beta-phosphoglucomutase-like phosphatase (HAD superfamily)
MQTLPAERHTTCEQISALIFDCDGTLIDSAPLYAKAWGASFNKIGHPFEECWYRARNGLSEDILIKCFETEFKTSCDRDALVRGMRDKYLSEITSLREITIIANVARAAKGKIAAAVASGGPRAIVEPSLLQLGLQTLFDAVVTIEDVGRPKPYPDLFLEAAHRLGAPPEKCLVFEDSLVGTHAAQAAGMRSILVDDIEAVEAILRQVNRAANG